MNRLRVLIYKRTHTGDPTPEGVFGLSDCMGRVRARAYDAVIGVGGLGTMPRSFDIDGRVTWVGVGPKRSDSAPVGHRRPIVEFDQFKLFEESGPKLASLAPALARHLFGIHRRVIMSDGLNDTIQGEITKILALATAPRRGARVGSAARPKCVPKRPKSGICRPRKRLRMC
jgi:hypothetical protein